MSYVLKNWSVIKLSLYQAPEVAAAHICGEVYDNPKFKDGTVIHTSPVLNANGRKVFTMTGSEYLLDGDPDPVFANFMNFIGIEINPDDPFNSQRLLKEEDMNGSRDA